MLSAPGSFGLSSGVPLDIHAAFWYGVLGRETRLAMTVATTRFSGRVFSAREVTLIGEIVRECSGLSRMELARTVCELLRWRRPNGRLKARECREFLERLDAEGALVLPDKRRGRALGSVTRVPRTAAGEPGRLLVGSVCDVEPLRVERVREPAARLLFRELWTLPLPRAHGPVRRAPALSGVCVEAGPGAGRLPAVLEPGVAHGGAGPLGRLGRGDAGSESPARGQQQPLPVAAVGQGEEPRQRGAGAGLGQMVVDWPRHYRLEPWLVETLVDPRPPRGFVSRRQLGRAGRHQRSRAHGPVRPPCR